MGTANTGIVVSSFNFKISIIAALSFIFYKFALESCTKIDIFKIFKKKM